MSRAHEESEPIADASHRGKRSERPALSGRARREQSNRITIYEGEFMAFVRTLHRTYPAEWIGPAILSEDGEMISGEIVARGPSEAIVLDRVAAYQRRHPGTPVRFFSTELAPSRSHSG